jgi:uncharacterized protein (TIGR01732 family)
MYYYGNSYGYGYPSSCCGGMGSYPMYGYGSGYGSNYAIILVLFILLVIIIGSRSFNR